MVTRILFIFLFVFSGAVFPQSTDIELQNRNYQRAVEEFENENFKKAESYVRKTLKANPENANSHHLLAKILLETKPTLYKLRSELEFKRALENDPDNLTFLIDLGSFYHEHNNPYKATPLFEKALRLDPDNPTIHYYLALSIDRKGLTDEAIEIANKALEINPEFDRATKFLDVVNERRIIFTRAERDLVLYEPKYFDEAIEIDRSYAEIYFSLGYRNFLEENFQKSIKIFEQISEKLPDYLKSIIFLWITYQVEGEYDKSRELFDKYRETLGNNYNFIWQISEMMLPESDKKKYKSLPEENRAEFLQKFWKSRDPLFSSEKSEREIEHYKRIAYAIITFSSDGMKWDKRGEVWIRFGPPTHLEEIPVPPRQIWTYEELGLTLKFAKFGDRYELFDFDKQELSYFSRNNPLGSMSLGQIARFEQYLSESSQSAIYNEKARETSEFFSYDYGGDAFQIPYYKADFKEISGNTNSEFYYGVPLSYFPSEPGKKFVLDNAIVILDEFWNEVHKNISQDEVKSASSSSGDIDSLIIFKSVTNLNPGDYYISIEVHDKNSGNIGIVREKINVKPFELEEFAISDIILAVDMSGAETESVFTKDGVNIFPHPAKQFNKTFPLYLYFEIYNLKFNRLAKTKFNVRTIVAEYQEDKTGLSGIFSKAASFLGLKKVKGLIENSYPYDGTLKDEKLHFGVDAANLSPGLYTLIIMVEDQLSGKKIERKQNFLLY
ncbi:tetratricopeptide repeat protein [candidate division KSB1 bacterium]